MVGFIFIHIFNWKIKMQFLLLKYKIYKIFLYFFRYPGSVNKPLNRNENLQKMLLIRAHQQAGQRARIRREATLESRMQDLLTDLEAELHGLQVTIV